jgi:hypothetical protein
MVRQAHHPEPSRRANLNNPNSKLQTNDPFINTPNGIIAGRPGFAKLYESTVVIVWSLNIEI